MHPFLRKIPTLVMALCLRLRCCYSSAFSDDELPAHWMSGEFGMGLRIMGGDFIERHETGGQNWGLDWTKLVDQFVEVGASWVIINLSQGAYGDAWMAYHPILYDINIKPDTSCVPYLGGNGWDGNCLTAPTPSESAAYFKDMADAFHAVNIKVIAYVASQGPAMFKHGTSKAFDVFRRTSPIRTNCVAVGANVGPKACFADPDSCCSPSVGSWIKFVKDLNGGQIDYPKLHEAFASEIIGYYAQTFQNDIDGWWFDHAQEKGSCGAGSTCSKDFIDRAAVRNAIRAHQPNVPIAFNTCTTKAPLMVCAKNVEDYTAGHPNPLGGGNPTLPFDSKNYPMVTSVEATPDGYLEDSGWRSLGHVFMPTGTAWNGPTITNVWTTPYPYTTTPYNWLDSSWHVDVENANGWNADASDWFVRVLEAKGAWTWNLPRQSNNPNTYFLLHPNHLAIVRVAAASLSNDSPESPSEEPSGKPSSSSLPSAVPSALPSVLRTQGSSSPSSIPSGKPSLSPSMTSMPSDKPSRLPSILDPTNTASSTPSKTPSAFTLEPSGNPNAFNYGNVPVVVSKTSGELKLGGMSCADFLKPDEVINLEKSIALSLKVSSGADSSSANTGCGNKLFEKELDVVFLLEQNLSCGGDCEAALAIAQQESDLLTENLISAVTSGDFAASISEVASTLGLTLNVTVDSSSLSVEPVEIEVITVLGPSMSPSPFSTECEGFWESFLRFIFRLVEFLSEMSFFRG